MDNPNITMEEYIRLEEEKARRHGKVRNRSFSEPRDGVTSYTQRRHNSSSDGATIFMTASAHTNSNADLEDLSYDGVLENQLLFASQLICPGKRDCVERIPSAGGNLRVLSVEEAWETIEDCAQCDKQWKNPTSTISDQTIANLKTQLVENEVVRVKIPKCMAWLDDEPIGDLDTMEDKVDNPSPQSTPQVLPSFEVYTPPVTHPKDVKETIGTLIEVEPLNETKLEEVGLNGINDPKRHYGFKPGLLGKSISLGVDISNWEIFDDDWGLESKEVSPLGEELSLFNRPNEVERGIILEAHRLEPILQQQISQRMAPSHHDGMYRYYHPHMKSTVGEPSPLSVK
ncbi:hypothetical protein Tco_0308344 [Tanacetum coccineum]